MDKSDKNMCKICIMKIVTLIGKLKEDINK